MSKPVFCPKCDTLLASETEESTIKQTCPNCDYKKTLDKSMLMRVNDYSKSAIKSMNRSMIYDSALRRTNTIDCPNPGCESLDLSKWGSTLDGRVIQPSISLTNFFSNDRITTYICNTCGQTFNPV
jgi:DNA-directed RNA polymerase subunit M/transcription elongation factor TFIIS